MQNLLLRKIENMFAIKDDCDRCPLLIFEIVVDDG